MDCRTRLHSDCLWANKARESTSFPASKPCNGNVVKSSTQVRILFSSSSQSQPSHPRRYQFRTASYDHSSGGLSSGFPDPHDTS
ncbi:hypothetical protein KC346_g17 [Hortaea werneckii]|nr:hypothetical protein KC346_g17 [Hortaea werneckii]